MTDVDVAVIGGGVTGLASALALARRGASVAVLEREAKTGRATSTHNSGVIHAGIYYPPGSLKARALRRGPERMYRFCETYRVPHARCGKLIIAADEHEIAELERLLRGGARQRRASLVAGRRATLSRPKSPTSAPSPRSGRPTPACSKPKRFVKALEHLCRESDVALVVGSPLLGAASMRRRHRARDPA